MKKIIVIALSMILLVSMTPVTAQAADILGELLGKLDSLGDSSGYSEEAEAAPAETGSYSPKQLYEMTAPKVVEITTYDASGQPMSRGSGFFIDSQGSIVTNYHVIQDASAAAVQTYDGSTYEVLQVMGCDAALDLAILDTRISGNQYLKMSDRKVSTGDTIYTLGSSLGLTGTFSDGLVSTASRLIDGVDYIQITAPISHGNSGGPLINSYGEVIGVNTMGFTDGQNINFAVNINELGRLDVSSPRTLAEVSREDGGTAQTVASAAVTDEALSNWLSNADMSEVESNDSFDWADVLRNDYYMAGCIEGIDDYDYYSLIVLEPTTIDAVILPYYSEDAEYLIGAIVDPEGNILAAAQAYEDSSSSYLNVTAEVTDPGTYYIILCVPDDYPYSEAAYYALNAVW